MVPGTGKTNFEGKPLNTLAQSGTHQVIPKQRKPAKVINGKGIEVSNKVGLSNRAKRKMITDQLSRKLVDVAKGKGNSSRTKSYWNTYHCQKRLTKSGGRIYGNICKNRFCTLCSSIRKAVIMNEYLPVIEKWEKPCFVTLTVRASNASGIQKKVDGVMRAFHLIQTRCKKRNQRGRGIKIVGIKSLECNFNPVKRTYNPHLHLIVANKEMGVLLIKEWCSLWTSKFTNPKAQHIEEIWNKEKALVEIVKYSTKIFTDPNMAKKGKSKTNPNVYVSALDNIITALQKHRIFDRFGFNLPARDKPIRISQLVTDYGDLIYNSKVNDWQDKESGELLTEFIPDARTVEILTNHINLTAQ